MQQQGRIDFFFQGHVERHGPGLLPDGQGKDALLGAFRGPGPVLGTQRAAQGPQLLTQGLLDMRINGCDRRHG